MNMQNDLVPAASGPHIDEPRIDPAVRQAELDYVIDAANAAFTKAVLRKLGRLSIALAREDNDQSYFLQIRSEPIASLDGCEFRFPMPARYTGEDDLDEIVEDVVHGAVVTTKMGRDLREFVSMTREESEKIIEPATNGIAQMRLIAIGFTPDLMKGPFETTIDVEMLGSDLHIGIERVTARDTKVLEEKLRKLVAKHLTRMKSLAEITVAGASGWVDEAALRIIDKAGFDRATIFDALRVERVIEFRFGGETGDDLSGAIYWEDGTLKADVEDRGSPTFRFEADELTIEGSGLPDTIISALMGRCLRDVIDIAYIPESAIIVGVRQVGKWLYLRLEIGRQLLDLTVGDAWPASRASLTYAVAV